MIASLQEAAKEHGLPLTTVIAEVLHLAILDCLFAIPESQAISFQDGTSIHLLYGGYRYSEDLGFAGADIDPAEVTRLVQKSQSNIEKNAIQLLGLGECNWRFSSPQTGRRTNVFWFHFQPQGMQQKFRIKLEFAAYPIYHPKVMPIQSALDILSRRPLVTGLTAEELFAEKIAAVAGRHYVKGRDLFDLWYFSEILQTNLEIELVKKKFNDYRVKFQIAEIKQKLSSYNTKSLTAEMERFLPQRHRLQLQKNDYALIYQAAVRVIQKVIELQNQ